MSSYQCSLDGIRYCIPNCISLNFEMRTDERLKPKKIPNRKHKNVNHNNLILEYLKFNLYLLFCKKV